MKKELKPNLGPANPLFLAQPTSALVMAAQALINGNADEAQQKIFMKWLVKDACGMGNVHYLPNERDTAFVLGRAFVGQQIEGLLIQNISTLRRVEK